MSTIVAEQYRLLAGPYRVMLWAMLSRFKTRFVGNLANEVAHLPFETRQAIVTRVAGSLQEFNCGFALIRQEYEDKLAESIVDLRRHGLTNIPATSTRELAACRVQQIESYLHDLVEKWRDLANHPAIAENSGAQFEILRNAIFVSISATVWPYYGVIYKVGLSRRNFATWVQKSELIAEPFLARISDSDDELRNAVLYPGMNLHDSLSGRCHHLLPRLANLLDSASDAFIDFDRPNKRRLDPVGLVQELDDDFIRTQTLVPIEWGRRHLDKKEVGRFVDLLFFNYWIVRCGIRLSDFDSEPDRQDPIPAGVLFLGMPCLNSFCHLVPPYEAQTAERLLSLSGEWVTPKEANLRQRMLLAWKEGGGMAFSRAFREDTIKLRTKLLADADATARARQGAAWAHDVKNWSAPIIENLAAIIPALKSSGSDGIAAAAKRAELNARLLNIISVGRQYAFQDLANRSEGSSSRPLLSRFKERFGATRELVHFNIDIAFQLLLALHRGTYLPRFRLEWQPRRDDASVFEEAEALLKDEDRAEMFSTIAAFLREIVHNIKIDRSKMVPGHDTINLTYRIEDEGTNILLRVSQHHIQEDKRGTAMPNGLVKANNLYGLEGARLGQIRRPILKNVSVPVSPGDTSSVFEVLYDLTVEFFFDAGEAGHAALENPQSAPAVH